MNRLRAFAGASAVSAVVAAGALLPAAPAAAHDSGTGDMGNACSVAGNISSHDGVRYSPNEGAYDISGVLDCTSEEYAHGVLTGRGTGLLGCFGGFTDAVYKIAWSNGQVSHIQVTSGDLTYGTGSYGMVTQGALTGSHVGMMWGRYAAGAEYKCANDAVRSGQFAGGIGIH